MYARVDGKETESDELEVISSEPLVEIVSLVSFLLRRMFSSCAGSMVSSLFMIALEPCGSCTMAYSSTPIRPSVNASNERSGIVRRMKGL